jgi:hypothetical protein
MSAKKSNTGIKIKNENVDVIIKEEKIDYDFEIIKTVKSSGNPESVPFLNDSQLLKVKQEKKVDEKIDCDLKIIKTTKTSGNPESVPLLNETELRIKREKNSVDVELLTVGTAKRSNNPNPLPLLNEKELKVKEESNKRKRTLDGLRKVATLIKSSEFKTTTKKVVNDRKQTNKKEVEFNLREKSKQLGKLLPDFREILEKENALLKNIQKLVNVLSNADDEDKLSDFDDFFNEFEMLWSSLKANKENSGISSKRSRNDYGLTSKTKPNKSDDLSQTTIESIKEEYLELLKRELEKYKTELKSSKDCLKDVEESKNLKRDVWKQYNDLLKTEIFINSKLETNGYTCSSSSEDESDDDDDE